MPEPGESFESAARTAPEPTEIRSAFERLLNSKAFRAARGQRRFLQYVVEETLAGRGSQIKEFTVGVEAFERGDGFDPRVDPIIRTEARKLRLRLARYYKEEGASETIRIELPKGSYIPVFVNRSEAENAPAETEPEVPIAALSSQLPPDVPEIAIRRPRAAALSACAVAALLVLLAGSWFVSAREPKGSAFDSIAVLPFVNRTGDPGQNALADGMTASLIERLSHEAGIQVMGRASVSTIRSAATNEAQLRSQLRAKTVLTATIEKSGQGFRLRIRLTDNPRTATVWSGSYTFEPHLRQLIEAELAAEVVHVLRTGKQADRPIALTREKKVPAGAWSAYLEGLHHQDRLDATGVARAIESFERATSLDPVCTSLGRDGERLGSGRADFSDSFRRGTWEDTPFCGTRDSARSRSW